MKYTGLDKIVRSVLNQKGYTIHWYFPYLKLASDCLRELHFDSLRVIQTKKIPVNQTLKTAPLPCDYVDYVKVGYTNGQFVIPLIELGSINRLPNYDSDGQKTAYGLGDQTTIGFGSYTSAEYLNDKNQHLGREFGYRASGVFDGFKELRERGELQLSELIDTDYIILEYISDGTGLCDAATKVDAYAQRAIEWYVMWKSSPNRSNPFSPEAEQFNAAHRVLRARKNNLTKAEVVRILNGR